MTSNTPDINLNELLEDHPEIAHQVANQAKKLARRSSKKKKRGRDKSGAEHNNQNAIKEHNLNQTVDLKRPYKEFPPIEPKSPKQADYIRTLFSRDVSIIFATGIWGSGKTGLATQAAIRHIYNPKFGIDKIVIARPAVDGENPIGFEPGSKNDKLTGWCAPVISELKETLGSAPVDLMIERGTIELLNIDQVKGRTFNNTFVIIDETEDLSFETIKTIIARHGYNCKTVLTGDVKQKDRGKKERFPHPYESTTGFGMAIELIQEDQKLHISERYLPKARVFNFNDWDKDCVRSEESKGWGKLLSNKGLL